MFGLVTSDPTVSRLITTLAGDVTAALAAINTARAAARAIAWTLAGDQAPDHGSSPEHPLIVDLDAALLTAHSDKQNAAPTFKRGYGFHPLCSFVDHGQDGTGEPLAILLRPGNAGSNTAADHITVTRDALRQLPFTAKGGRVGRKARPSPRRKIRALTMTHHAYGHAYCRSRRSRRHHRGVRAPALTSTSDCG